MSSGMNPAHLEPVVPTSAAPKAPITSLGQLPGNPKGRRAGFLGPSSSVSLYPMTACHLPFKLKNGRHV